MIYEYPLGDFISGFSTNGIVCEYEKKCQQCVINGMYYLEDNPIDFANKDIFHDDFIPLIKSFKQNDLTGNMVNASLQHLYYAQKNGWQKYLSELKNHLK